tara:strand:+ start:127 stop:396 length:270 start_codon:yes stop_codon:yes gene_type:complete
MYVCTVETNQQKKTKDMKSSNPLAVYQFENEHKDQIFEALENFFLIDKIKEIRERDFWTTIVLKTEWDHKDSESIELIVQEIREINLKY